MLVFMMLPTNIVYIYIIETSKNIYISDIKNLINDVVIKQFFK